MWWKSLANAIAHDELSPYLQGIYIGCERCGNPHMLIVHYEEDPPENQHEEIILTSSYFLKCPECGFEEGDMIITIIPSWQWHNIRSRFVTKGGKKRKKVAPSKKRFMEKLKLADLWMRVGR